MSRYNETYYSNCLTHDKLLPGGFCTTDENAPRIPYGVEFLDGGRVKFIIYAACAKSVELDLEGTGYCLTQASEDVWQTVVRLEPGYRFVNVLIDGREVLYPFLPIGFGGGKPCNFVDIPLREENCDYEIRNVRHGMICTEYLYANATQKHERFLVYLPPDYFEQPQKRYPVLYLQHGLGENETSWVYQGKLNFIYDNLIAENKAIPAICVMCCGMVQSEKLGKRLVDHRLLEELLLEDIIPHIDHTYRTLADRTHRALAGLSMGSIQTSYITFRHQETFAWAGLFSGFLKDIISCEYSYLEKPFTDTYNTNMRLLFRCMGEEDPYYPNFLEEDKLCEEKGLRCIRKTFHGTHNWQAFRTGLLSFLPLVFREENC